MIKDDEYKTSDNHCVHTGDELATCLYHFHWSEVINDETCSGSDQWTSVLINTYQGWQLLTEHIGPLAN